MFLFKNIDIHFLPASCLTLWCIVNIKCSLFVPIKIYHQFPDVYTFQLLLVCLNIHYNISHWSLSAAILMGVTVLTACLPRAILKYYETLFFSHIYSSIIIILFCDSPIRSYSRDAMSLIRHGLIEVWSISSKTSRILTPDISKM